MYILFIPLKKKLKMMKSKIFWMAIVGLLTIGLQSCGKRKDKKDTLRISLISTDGSTVLPHGANVEVYANGELYFQGTTNEEAEGNPGSTSVLFRVEDRLSGDADRIENLQYVIVTLGDSISNISAPNINTEYDLSTHFSTALSSSSFQDKQTDEIHHTVYTYPNYFGLFRGSKWNLTTAYLNGTEAGLVTCAQDNYIEFNNFFPHPQYSEGNDVCSGGNGILRFGSEFYSTTTINGSTAKSATAESSSYMTVDGVTVNMEYCYLIYPDTLVFSGSDGTNTLDYYFTKE